MEIVTISRNKRVGDRSYSHGIWQVISYNQQHVMVYPLMDDFWGKIIRREKHLLLLDEYDIVDARSLLTDKEYQHCLVMASVELIYSLNPFLTLESSKADLRN